MNGQGRLLWLKRKIYTSLWNALIYRKFFHSLIFHLIWKNLVHLPFIFICNRGLDWISDLRYFSFWFWVWVGLVLSFLFYLVFVLFMCLFLVFTPHFSFICIDRFHIFTKKLASWTVLEIRVSVHSFEVLFLNLLHFGNIDALILISLIFLNFMIHVNFGLSLHTKLLW